MAGKALTSYKRLVRNRYPNPADKTDANYEELCMLMSTDLGDHTYPGNKIRQYVDQKVKFMNFLREDGCREKSTGVLRCMRELRAANTRLGPAESSRMMNLYRGHHTKIQLFL